MYGSNAILLAASMMSRSPGRAGGRHRHAVDEGRVQLRRSWQACRPEADAAGEAAVACGQRRRFDCFVATIALPVASSLAASAVSVMCSLALSSRFSVAIDVGPATPSTERPYLRWNAFRRCRVWTREVGPSRACLKPSAVRSCCSASDVAAAHPDRAAAACRTAADEILGRRCRRRSWSTAVESWCRRVVDVVVGRVPPSSGLARGSRAAVTASANKSDGGCCELGANRSQLWSTTNQPFLFPAPTGLAVGLALKEFALRHISWRFAPRAASTAHTTGSPAPPRLCETDSAGCAGAQHNSTST